MILNEIKVVHWMEGVFISWKEMKRIGDKFSG